MSAAPSDAADYQWPHPPTLADRQRRYLEVRQHTLSTAGLPALEAINAQADYVAGEAGELREAVRAFGRCCVDLPDSLCADRLTNARHEIADVVLAAVGVANRLGVTVESCIAEKTEADRGRG